MVDQAGFHFFPWTLLCVLWLSHLSRLQNEATLKEALLHEALLSFQRNVMNWNLLTLQKYGVEPTQSCSQNPALKLTSMSQLLGIARTQSRETASRKEKEII